MSPSTEPLDDPLADMGRAFAHSLLDDLTDAPPPPPPSPKPVEHTLVPSAEGEPLNRRARRELREQREREATVSSAAPGVAEPPTERPAAPSPAPMLPPSGLVRRGDVPVRSEGGGSVPVAPDGRRFQVARPHERPVPTTEAPTDRSQPTVRHERPQSVTPIDQPSSPARHDRTAHGRPPVVRSRVRHVERDPYAALPWPKDEAVFFHEGRLAPEDRPGSLIRDLDLTVARAQPTTADDLDPGEASPGRQRMRSAIEWAMVLVTTAVVVLLLTHFVVQLYKIPSESMYPALTNNDQVMVNKLSYVVGGAVERGDVIVFKRPASERTDDPDQPPQLIKRVIGLPGDVVEARGGVVYIGGKPLPETGDGNYLDPSVVTNNLAQPVTVPVGHVFVMGDNRERSHDSRYFGPIAESDIIGRAVVIAWPFSRWGFL